MVPLSEVEQEIEGKRTREERVRPSFAKALVPRSGATSQSSIGRRGWLDPEGAFGGDMLHNWTLGEMNLIRDVFVCEEGDALSLGLGVAKGWLVPGSGFGVTDIPPTSGG